MEEEEEIGDEGKSDETIDDDGVPRSHNKRATKRKHEGKANHEKQIADSKPKRKRSLEDTPLSDLTPGGERPTVPPPRSLLYNCCLASTGCTWKGPLEAVPNHAREQHRNLLLLGPTVNFMVPLSDFKENEPMARLIDAHGELFVLHLKQRTRELQIAVQLVGPRTRALTFLYLVSMKIREPSLSPQGGPLRMSFLVHKPHSWLDPLDAAFQTLWCAQQFTTTIQNRRILLLGLSFQKAPVDTSPK